MFKNKKLWLLILLVFCCGLVWNPGFADAGKTPDPSPTNTPIPVVSPAPTPTETPIPIPTPTPVNPSPTPSPSPSPEEGVKTPQDFYLPYIQNPLRLGMDIDNQVLLDCMSIVKTRSVWDVDTSKIYAAMKEEVTFLLESAKLDIAPLKALKTDASFPEAAAKLYQDKIGSDLVYFACLCGIPKGLSDPFTDFMLPEQYGKMMEMMSERGFGGAGMSIDLDQKRDNQLFILEVFEDTPAEKAGLKSEDRIMAIDGFSTKGITTQEAQSRIRGPIGTTVVLTISRKNVIDPLKITVTRGNIVVHSIKMPPQMLAGNIGYLKTRFFSAGTSGELAAALKEMKAQGAKAVIIDLRNNGGGYLNTAVAVAEQFLPKGKVVVKIGEKNPKNTVSYSSNNSKPFELPVVLLTNKYSASASEILAGCLQDQKRATIVGDKTFGKGSVQQVVPMKGGSAMKVTVALFYTPNGRKINKAGVTPEILKPMELGKMGTDKDIQLQAALDYLKNSLKGTKVTGKPGKS